MSNYCASCGAAGCSTRVCSMCYGDPDYGTDGHYRREIERHQQELEYERQREEAEERDHEEQGAQND